MRRSQLVLGEIFHLPPELNQHPLSLVGIGSLNQKGRTLKWSEFGDPHLECQQLYLD